MPVVTQNPKDSILITSDAIKDQVRKLAHQIDLTYAGKVPILMGILTGSFVFMADLVRSVTIPHEIDFVKVQAYGKGTEPHQVKWLMGPGLNVENRHLVVVDDIIDTGETATLVQERLRIYRPQSINFCFLLSKIERRKHSVLAPYIGFDVDFHFVYGYGLDLRYGFRDLPDIWAVSEGRL